MFKKFTSIMLALATIVLMLTSLSACGKDTADTSSDDKKDGITAKNIKIGVILIGDENEGYTMAHIEGIEAAKKTLGIADSQVIYKYKVPENETCYDTARDLAEDGCNIIFANSFSHESYMIKAAKEYPNVMFCHATGQTAAKQKDMNNITNYFTNIYESRYVAGVVAGLKLKEIMDKDKSIEPNVGYVGAYPYAEVVSGYTAFFLGIQSIVPSAKMEVKYTNSWFNIAAEAEAANALIADGCVIIGQHADSTGAPSACEAASKEDKTVFCVGYNVDMLSVAPDCALTSAQNNWDVYYTYAIKAMIDGEKIKTDWSAGYKEGAVQISKLGNACAAGTAGEVEKVINSIKDGTLHVFDTSKWTVGGKKLDSYDKSYGFDGVQLIWDGYFHESEVISAPLFDIRIDGITELNAK